jgi:hypothetical protein
MLLRPWLACAGETRSEGGFAENKVSVASLLDVQEAKDQKGKSYYKYEILTRTGAGTSEPFGCSSPRVHMLGRQKG